VSKTRKFIYVSNHKCCEALFQTTGMRKEELYLIQDRLWKLIEGLYVPAKDEFRHRNRVSLVSTFLASSWQTKAKLLYFWWGDIHHLFTVVPLSY